MVLAAMLGGLALGCTVQEPQHCANLAGDQTCAVRYGDDHRCSTCTLERDGCAVADLTAACEPVAGVAEHCAFQPMPDAFCVTNAGTSRPYCSVCAPWDAQFGCVAQPPTDACGGNDGSGETGGETNGETNGETGSSSGSTSGDDTSTGDEETTDTSAESDTTGPPPECTEMDGALSDACQSMDPLEPFCSAEGICVSCEGTSNPDLACANEDPTTPRCDAGTCVACIDNADCPAAAPVCETNECRGCLAHGECASGACKLQSGACFAIEDARWVDSDKQAADCVGADGLTASTALCSIADAKADLSAEGVLFLRSATNTYQELITILPGEEFAVIGVGTPAPVVTADASINATATVSSATAYLANLDLSGNTLRSGVLCDDLSNLGSAAVYLTENMRIAINNRYGVEADGCALTLDHVSIHDNDAGGLLVVNGDLSMVNTSVSFNGVFGATNATGAVTLVDTAVTRFAYNSLVYNEATEPSAHDSLSCGGAVTGALRNSILTGRTVESISPTCPATLTIEHSVVDAAALVGGTNVDAGAVNNNRFVNATEGDLHLSSIAPPGWSTTASYQAGDPTTDIDGEIRGAPVGAVGVDEPN